MPYCYIQGELIYGIAFRDTVRNFKPSRLLLKGNCTIFRFGAPRRFLRSFVGGWGLRLFQLAGQAATPVFPVRNLKNQPANDSGPVASPIIA